MKINNKRFNEFISDIIADAQKIRNIDDLSLQFNVSSRTIRNYCDSFFELISELGLDPAVLVISKNTIIYNGDQEDTQQIVSAIEKVDLYNYHLDSDERAAIITLELLINDYPLSLGHFTESLFISRSTFMNDLNRVKTYLDLYQLDLLSSSSGYFVRADEQTRQDIMTAICYPHLKEDDALHTDGSFFNKLINQILDIEKISSFAGDLVNYTENLYGININDTFFSQAVFSLSLLCRRLIDKNYLKPLKKIDPQLLDTSVGKIADRLLNSCSERFGFDYSDQEIVYLAWRLHLCHFDLLQNFEHSIDLFFYSEVTRFLSNIDKQIDTDFLNDHDFSLMMTKHIWSIRNGNISDIDFGNKELVSNYSEVYKVITDNIHIIESCINRKCTDNELLSILLYVVAEIERKARKKQRPRVIVLCHVGIGTAHYLADRLLETFNIEIVDVLSIHKLPDVLKRDDYDFIISTVSLKDPDAYFITVSPTLDDDDIITVQRMIVNTLRKEDYKPSKNVDTVDLSEIVKINNIILDEPCSDWKGSVRIAAGPLLIEGSINQAYIEDIIESVETNGPYFVFAPSVALVHAGIQNVNDMCLSFYRPKEPIHFHHPKNDPVRLVVMIGLTDPKNQVSYISTLMKVLADKNRLDDLLRSQDTETFKSVLLR